MLSDDSVIYHFKSAAKHQGRDRVVWDGDQDRDDKLARALPDAIAAGALRLHAQPIISMLTVNRSMLMFFSMVSSGEW